MNPVNVEWQSLSGLSDKLGYIPCMLWSSNEPQWEALYY